MNRSLTIRPWAALALAACLSTQPAAAAEPPAPLDPKEELRREKEELRREREEMRKELDRFSRMNAAIEKIKTDLEALSPRINEELRSIRDAISVGDRRMSQLSADVADLRNRQRSVTSTSLSPSTTSTSVRLRLVNEHTEEVSVIINGGSFRVLPGETRELTAAPGSLTYQVLNVQSGVQQRDYAAGETVVVRVHPRR